MSNKEEKNQNQPLEEIIQDMIINKELTMSARLLDLESRHGYRVIAGFTKVLDEKVYFWAYLIKNGKTIDGIVLRESEINIEGSLEGPKYASSLLKSTGLKAEYIANKLLERYGMKIEDFEHIEGIRYAIYNIPGGELIITTIPADVGKDYMYVIGKSENGIINFRYGII